MNLKLNLLNKIIESQLRKNLNKFTLQVDEMSCPICQVITGHVVTGKFWTCCNCGHQLGIEKKLNFLQRLFKK